MKKILELIAYEDENGDIKTHVKSNCGKVYAVGLLHFFKRQIIGEAGKSEEITEKTIH